MKTTLLSTAMVMFQLIASSFADDPNLRVYERTIEIHVTEETNAFIKLEYYVYPGSGKTGKIRAQISLDTKTRNMKFIELFILGELEFKQIVYSVEREYETERKWHPSARLDPLGKPGEFEYIESGSVGVHYIKKGSNAVTPLTVEGLRAVIFYMKANEFKNDPRFYPTIAQETQIDPNKKAINPLDKVSSGGVSSDQNAVYYKDKKFIIKISNDRIVIVNDAGRELIVAQPLPASYRNNKTVSVLEKKGITEDGLLNLNSVNRVIDLENFDGEIDLIGHSLQPQIVVNGEEGGAHDAEKGQKPFDPADWVTDNFPDLVAEERLKMKDKTSQDLDTGFHHEEFQDILSVLSAGKSVRLTGPSGSGKSTKIKLLARAIARGEIKGVPRTTQIRALSASALESGTKYRGSLDTRIQALIAYAKKTKTIFFIDEFHTMSGVGAGSGSSTNSLNSLKEELANGNMRIIGSSTLQEWNNAFASDSALNRRFLDVENVAPNGDKLIKTMRNAFRMMNQQVPSDDLLQMAIDLTNRFSVMGSQPSMAMDILARAGQIVARQSGSWKSVMPTKEAIQQAVMKAYKVDSAWFNQKEITEKIKSLEAVLNEKMVGQDLAKKQVMDFWLRSLAGVGSEENADTMIFMGPPGVGKTFISKLIAKALGYKSKIIEMNKYATGDVEAFRYEVYLALMENPLTIFVLDEIEKAHPTVQNAALSMIQPGSFTVNIKDAHGKTVFEEVRCTNAKFEMTTNAGQAAVEMISAAQSGGPLGFRTTEHTASQEKPRMPSDTTLRTALVQGGIVQPLVSRAPTIVALGLPSRDEFAEAVRRAVADVLKRESTKKKKEFVLLNPDLFVEYVLKSYSAGYTDYRQVEAALQKDLELWIAREFILAGADKHKITIPWQPWISGQGLGPCEEKILSQKP